MLTPPYCVSVTMTSAGHDIVVMNTTQGIPWRVPHAEQEMLTLPEHLISPLVFIQVRVVISFVSPDFM